MKTAVITFVAAWMLALIVTFTATSVIIVADVTLCAFQPSCTITLTHRR